MKNSKRNWVSERLNSISEQAQTLSNSLLNKDEISNEYDVICAIGGLSARLEILLDQIKKETAKNGN